MSLRQEIGSFVVAFGVVASIMLLTGASWLSILVVGIGALVFGAIHTWFQKSPYYTTRNRIIGHSLLGMFFLVSVVIQYGAGDYVWTFLAFGLAVLSAWRIYSLSSSSNPL